MLIVAVRIATAVVEALLPTLNEMRSDLNNVRDTVNLLNETVKTLAGEFEQHRDEFETELADTQASIKSLIENPPIDEISKRVLQLLRPNLNNIEEEIKTYIRETVMFTETILRDELMEYKNQTTSKLADLQSSISANLSCVKTNLADLQSSVDRVNDTLNHVNDTNTDQLMQLCAKMDTLQEKLYYLDTKISNNTALVNTTLNSELTSVNTKLDLIINKLFSDEFNDVETELNGTNDTTNDTSNEVVDEIEEHDNQTDNKPTDTESLICDSHEVDCCGGTGGWRRVVYLDMTDPNTDCPSGWIVTNYNNTRTCGRASDAYNTCDSVYYTVNGGEYSQVCGKMKGYQWGWTVSFWGYNHARQTTIDQAYFSGVAVMHGRPRQHIWSFASGAAEKFTLLTPETCPCDTSYNVSIPSFVGNDYFCESGYIYPGIFISSEVQSLHSDDPLWDGDGCDSSSTCCTYNDPPYFIKHLDNSITDDIELRMCCFHPLRSENVAVELVEIYVK